MPRFSKTACRRKAREWMIDMKILYYSGYLRNRSSLCRDLAVPALIERRQQDMLLIERAWQKWGKGFCSRLYGDFAIVLEEKDHILLFRDYFGIEPLYYAEKNGKLFFSGSVSELLSRSVVSGAFNEQMMRVFFLYGHAIGEDTFYREVYKLLPGHLLVWNISTSSVEEKRAWFTPDFDPVDIHQATYWADRIRKTLQEIFEDEKENIRRNKTGSFLSSGVDSSYMLALTKISRAYCAAYDPRKYMTEAPDARATAGYLQRDFHEVRVDAADFAEAFEAVTAAQDQPSSNGSLPAFYLACQEAAKENTLMFSGEGPDEFFAGYKSHDQAEAIASDRLQPYLGCGQMITRDQYEMLMKCPLPAMPDVHKRLCDDTANSAPLSRMLRTDIALFLEGDTLSYMALMKEMTGLEISLPFLDSRFFALASIVPDDMKCRPLSGAADEREQEAGNKYVFRLAAIEKLPQRTAFRKKIGFFAPVSKMLTAPELRARVESLIFGALSRQFFRQEYLQSAWQSLCSGETDFWCVIYPVFSFLAWYEKHFDPSGKPIITGQLP